MRSAPADGERSGGTRTSGARRVHAARLARVSRPLPFVGDPPLQRLTGAAFVVLGWVLAVIDLPDSRDPVLVSLSLSHGVHVTDLLGGLLVAAGVALLWRAAAVR